MEKQPVTKPIIRAVIFDLGGVILRTNDPQPRQALAERMGRTYIELDDIVFSNPVSRQAERGQASPTQVWEEIGQLLHLESRDIPAFRREFFAGDTIDPNLVELIQNLRTDYKTALLSNTWIIDLPSFLRQDLGVPDIFDIVISSAKSGIAKPDAKIFLHTLDALGVGAEESVFVDDNLENILAAGHLGMHTVRFLNPEQAQDDLLKILQHSDSEIGNSSRKN